MAARHEYSSMRLALAAGQVQRVLVEAGSTLVVTQGEVRLRFPFAWIADCVVAREISLCAEAALCLEAGGWVDLEAKGGVEMLVLQPEKAGLWASVGRILAQKPPLQQKLEVSTAASTGTKRGAGFRLSPE